MDTLKSLWEDLSDRFKSPFVVSFLLVWSVRNWKLLYTVFNFDETYHLNSKIAFIEDYIKVDPYRISLYPLALSILAALLFYLMKSVFYSMDTFYENKAKIWIVSKINSKELVAKSDLERAYLKNAELLQSFEEQRKLFMTSNSQIERLQTEIVALKNQNGELRINKAEFENLQKQLTVFESNIHKVKTLNDIFYGNWICEYQYVKINSADIVRGAEQFVINENRYFNGNDIRFTISDVTFINSTQVLTFIKSDFTTPSEKISVFLFKMSDTLWCGYERQPNLMGFSVVRYYPFSRKPDNFIFLSLEKKDSSYNGDINHWVQKMKNPK